MIPLLRKEFFPYPRFMFFILSIIGSISCSSRNDNTLTFLQYFCDTQDRIAVDNIIKEFEENNRCNVDVKYYDNSKGPNELISILTGKQKCDVVAFNSEWLAQLQDKVLLYDFPKEKNIDTFYYDLLIDYCRFNGKFYCLPWLVNTRVLYVNKKIINENKLVNLPLDFQQLFDNSELINELGKYYGIGLVGPNKQAMFKNMLPIILSFGGELSDSTGELDLNKNINSTGIYYYLKSSRSGLLETKREIENQFIEGHIAYCISDLSLLQKILEKNLINNFKIEQISQNGKNPGVSYSDAVMIGICSYSEKKELSLKLIKELAEWKSKNSYSKDLLKFGVPVRKNYTFNFIDNKSYNSAHDNISFVIYKQIINSRLAPRHFRWFEIESIFENEIEKAIYSEKSIEGSLNDAQEEITNFLKRVKK